MPQQRELRRGGQAYLLARSSPRPTSPHPSSSLRKACTTSSVLPPPSSISPAEQRHGPTPPSCLLPRFDMAARLKLELRRGGRISNRPPSLPMPVLPPDPVLPARRRASSHTSYRHGVAHGGMAAPASSAGQGLPRQWRRHGAEAAAVEAARSRGRPGPEISGARGGIYTRGPLIIIIMNK